MTRHPEVADATGCVLEPHIVSGGRLTRALLRRCFEPQTTVVLWTIAESPLRVSVPKQPSVASFSVTYLAQWFVDRGAKHSSTLAHGARAPLLQAAKERQQEVAVLQVSSTWRARRALHVALERALWHQKHRGVVLFEASVPVDVARLQRLTGITRPGDGSRNACCGNHLWRKHGAVMQVLHRCTDDLFAVEWPANVSGPDIVEAVAEEVGLFHAKGEAYLAQRLSTALAQAQRVLPFWRRSKRVDEMPVFPKQQWSEMFGQTVALPPGTPMFGNPEYFVASSSGTTGTPLLVLYEMAVKAARRAAESSRWARTEMPRFAVLNRTSNLFHGAHPKRLDLFRVQPAKPLRLLVSPGVNPTRVPSQRWQRVAKALASFAPTVLAADAQYLMGFATSRHFAVPKTLRELILATNGSWGFQRAFIAKQYGITPRVLYHTGETGAVAISCARHAWHLVEAYAHYEIFARGKAAGPGELGLLLATTFDTKVRPLFRYPIGDVLRLAPRQCNCGTPGRTVIFEGRLARMFQDGRGQWVTTAAFDRLIPQLPGVHFLRVVRGVDDLCLQYIGEAGAKLPTKRLATLLQLPVRSERVASLPIETEGGKLGLLSVPERQQELFTRFTNPSLPPLPLFVGEP